MTAYAKNTSVPSERTRAEIEGVLRRYGADQFISGWDASSALIGFTAKGRQIKFRLEMPDRTERRFTHRKTTHGSVVRPPPAAEREWEQAIRQKWRALLLVIKAKLEAVESGISTFEKEFLANVVLPDGQTVGDFMIPHIEIAYSSGRALQLAAHVEES